MPARTTACPGPLPAKPDIRPMRLEQIFNRTLDRDITMCRISPRLISWINAAIVDDFPQPVGPVIKIKPFSVRRQFLEVRMQIQFLHRRLETHQQTYRHAHPARSLQHVDAGIARPGFAGTNRTNAAPENVSNSRSPPPPALLRAAACRKAARSAASTSSRTRIAA